MDEKCRRVHGFLAALEPNYSLQFYTERFHVHASWYIDTCKNWRLGVQPGSSRELNGHVIGNIGDVIRLACIAVHDIHVADVCIMARSKANAVEITL